MLDSIVHAGLWSLCWFNSGGFWVNMDQIQEYLKARIECGYE